MLAATSGINCPHAYSQNGPFRCCSCSSKTKETIRLRLSLYLDLRGLSRPHCQVTLVAFSAGLFHHLRTSPLLFCTTRSAHCPHPVVPHTIAQARAHLKIPGCPRDPTLQLLERARSPNTCNDNSSHASLPKATQQENSSGLVQHLLQLFQQWCSHSAAVFPLKSDIAWLGHCRGATQKATISFF